MKRTISSVGFYLISQLCSWLRILTCKPQNKLVIANSKTVYDKLRLPPATVVASISKPANKATFNHDYTSKVTMLEVKSQKYLNNWIQ